jgi:hypothetical protein
MIMNPYYNPHAADRHPGGRRARNIAATGPAPASVDELYICVLCAGYLVYPFSWEAEGPRHWRVFLRCPDCEVIREGLFTQQAVDLLADELDRGSGILIKGLERLTRENMAAEIEILVRALEEDMILPSDF